MPVQYVTAIMTYVIAIIDIKLCFKRHNPVYDMDHWYMDHQYMGTLFLPTSSLSSSFFAFINLLAFRSSSLIDSSSLSEL